MTKRGSLRAAAGLIVLGLTAASCAGDARTAAGRLTNTLTITGNEYAFELDRTSIDAGTVQVTFKNVGTEEHVVGWQRLKAGTTFQAFSDAVRSDWERAMGLKDPATGLVEDQDPGGPTGVLSPGQQSTVTTNLLQAGSYALLCYIPAPDGPHLALGMAAGIEVKAEAPPPTPFDVETDGEVTLTEYSFGTLPQALTTGKGTFRFTNAGEEPHSLTLVRFQPGMTFEDMDAYLKVLFEGDHPPSTPSPVVNLGGFVSLAPGTSIWLTIDLPPGTYGLECDQWTAAEKEHGRDLGMRATFDVAS